MFLILRAKSCSSKILSSNKDLLIEKSGQSLFKESTKSERWRVLFVWQAALERYYMMEAMEAPLSISEWKHR